MPVGVPPLIMMTAPIFFEIIFCAMEKIVSENNVVTGGLLMTDSTEAFNPKV
jgi:hypothetical protein